MRPYWACVAAAAAREKFADGEWRVAEPVADPRTLRTGETLLWKGPGPTPARWPCIPTTLARIDQTQPMLNCFTSLR